MTWKPSLVEDLKIFGRLLKTIFGIMKISQVWCDLRESIVDRTVRMSRLGEFDCIRLGLTQPKTLEASWGLVATEDRTQSMSIGRPR